ncbi:MAG: LysR family transcriptional regulator [Lachnospiraceae bacterium]|nr:LysR family transcriptional regulator [Lachnospiraceae bacterium]
MTLKQLNYIVTIADTGSITEASKKLFLAQPSLTASVHELEKEFGITIFSRSNKGIEVTPEGEEFLGYARQIIEQTGLIEERYTGQSMGKQKFFVSSQHYSFAVEAFVRLLKECGGDRYEFHMRETQTYEIIEDVARLRSEIGVLYRNRFNETVINKTLRDNNLIFEPLFTAKPHVFIGRTSPLAKKRKISLEDLKPYPRLSYEQGSHNSFYFSEEILSTMDCDRELVVCDRATLFNLLIGLNGYTVCSGVINEELNGPGIIAKPLQVDDCMEIGYILPAGIRPSALTANYIRYLKESVSLPAAKRSRSGSRG